MWSEAKQSACVFKHVGELCCFIIAVLTLPQRQGISVCLPPSLLHPPPPLILYVPLLFSVIAIHCLVPPHGLQHRRRLASQWSNFTAVDADV